jgi:two-component system sensor histidine kinase DesK
MLNRFTTHRFAAAGALAYLLFGGIEVLVLLVSGVGGADLNLPAGVLAEYVASWFSEAPSLVRAGGDRRALTYAIVVCWQAVMTLMFAAIVALRPRLKHRPRLGAVVLTLQMVGGVSTLSSLLYVLAAELAFIKPLRQGLTWLAAQMGLLSLAVLYMVFVRGYNLGDATIELVFIYSGFGLVFQAIAFGMAQVAVRERAARTALAASNAHLLATQSMLADTVRAVERVRIARDLHDAVGHHLTALNLHLDLALRQAQASVPESLRTSRELARSLLAEVRAVVSSERSDQCINLRAAIDTMCAGIPSPRIACAFEDGLEIASPVLANTLFYCVQEALTNAARHADADLLSIDIHSSGNAIALTVSDDGRGSAGAPEGNGLRGMRERVEEQGGTLRCDTQGPGFAIAICLPLNRSAA